jgi:tRNA-specific adenosine deaminase 3
MNVIRRIADYRTSTPPGPSAEENVYTLNKDASQNGGNYLLTSLVLFTTHEPCVMCSMALLHSRVKAVFYFLPMRETGGCGGITCLPKLEGVNHRFDIYQWKGDTDVIGLQVDPSVDA